MNIWFVPAEPRTLNQFVLMAKLRVLVCTCNDQPTLIRRPGKSHGAATADHSGGDMEKLTLAGDEPAFL